MNPAFSVIFLTTLLGLAQGLFVALYLIELVSRNNAPLGSGYFVSGAVICLLLAAGGLIASIFHLGHPERGWRAAAMWRTSWLSREVIALPAFMALVFAWGVAHYSGLGHTVLLGALALVASLVLFICTGMIYACIRFLQEWASPLTVINYLVLGLASGTVLAAVHASVLAPQWSAPLAVGAVWLTLIGFITRLASLRRNRALRPQSNLASAIGIRHPRIQQKAQGFMGGSYNTREYFHGKTIALVKLVKNGFLLGAFVLPLAALLLAQMTAANVWLWIALVVQYVGLLAERWYFFADAKHPQNLYYQAIM